MCAYSAEFKHAIDPPWTSLAPLLLCKIPTGLGTPDAYLLISRFGDPALRVDIYEDRAEEAHIFREVKLWHSYVAAGWGHRAYLINPANASANCFPTSSYFSGFAATDDVLLIVSGCGMTCIERDLTTRWVNDEIAADGIVITRIEHAEICGNAEHNPPGGWKQFRLSLATGQRIDNT